MAKQESNNYLDKTVCLKAEEFWMRGAVRGPQAPPPVLHVKWMGGGPPEQKLKFDNECHDAFASYLATLEPDRLLFNLPQSYEEERQQAEEISSLLMESKPDISTEAGARELLGTIILLDQIPRNIYRNNQRMIYTHFDVLCRSIVRTVLVASPPDQLHDSIRYSLPHRMWLWLPLMHSEALEDHRLFDEQFAAFKRDLLPLADETTVKFVEACEEFEKKHADILESFGRYCYRNKHLGREPTKAELEFLENGGDTFGTG